MNKQNDDAKPPVLVDTDGVRGAPASTFGKGAKNGEEVVAAHRPRDVTEWRDRRNSK
jgi:hypothetical protein